AQVQLHFQKHHRLGNCLHYGLALGLISTAARPSLAQVDLRWPAHDRTRPLPTVITPATGSTPTQGGKAPSDATVLFDGKDLSHWVSMDGRPTRWVTRDGYMECVKGSGYIRTLQNFGDCQLHIEWATLVPGEG